VNTAHPKDRHQSHHRTKSRTPRPPTCTRLAKRATVDRRAGVSPAPTWPHSSSSPPAAPILVDAMTDTGLPHLPGVATVSQILSALEAEYTELKFFPTQAAVRANYLKSIRSARFWPTGGISTTNAAQYLALPNVG
jgi:hypothetical protein